MDGNEDQLSIVSKHSDISTTLNIFKEDSNFELTKLSQCKALGINVNILPKTGTFTIQKDYTSNENKPIVSTAYTPVTEVVDHKNNVFVRGAKASERVQQQIMGNTTGELEGEKGEEEAAGWLDKEASVLNATGIGAPVGEAIALFSLSMKTSLDLKNKDPKTAFRNLFVRGTLLGFGKFAEKQIEKLDVNDAAKRGLNSATEQTSGKIEDTITGDEKGDTKKK